MYHEKQAITESIEVTDSTTNIKISNRSKTQDKDLQNKNYKNYTFWGNCWKCGKFGNSLKECQNNLTMANQDQTHNGPTNIQTIQPIRYPTPLFPAKLPVLTQQIMADFQLSQEAWNKLSSQMNEMSKTNKLLKVKSTYKKTKKYIKTICQEGS